MKSPTTSTTPAQRKHSPSIEVELRDIGQLFNAMDPSPVEERDLSASVEEFIVSWMEEYSATTSVSLRVHLEEWPENDPTTLVRNAIHNYFAYRADVEHGTFQRLMTRGRISLAIGLLFLMTCLIVSRLIFRDSASTWAGFGRESLTIAGWVAMWRPMEIYLYDWWPVRRVEKAYRKLSRIPVDVLRRVGGRD